MYKVVGESICLNCGQALEQRERQGDFDQGVTQWVHYTGDVICQPTTTAKPDPSNTRTMKEVWS